MKYHSQLISLSEIVAQEKTWTFTIPIYQRLYVWGEDQVSTLLNDLVNAFERDEDIFFLGGTLVVEQECLNGRNFELIDGQQRFTTLWMLCHAWRGAMEPFLAIESDKRTEPRIRFAIRPKVNAFLRSLVFQGDDHQDELARETTRMREAIATMTSLFQKRTLPAGTSQQDYLARLSDFVFRKVKLIFTTVPPSTDLNKLFEVINNRGVQLQHHEILKARMLDALDDTERRAYAILWDSCADQQEFVERSLAGNSHLKAKDVAKLYDREEAEYDKEKLGNADAVLEALQREIDADVGSEGALTLDEILADSSEVNPDSEKEESTMEGTRWVRSIIGFPMFLQHALRIWLHRKGEDDLPRILDRELLTLFEDHFFKNDQDEENSKKVRSFIKLLWELRYRFDKHIIKWVDQDGEEVHMISRLSPSQSRDELYLSRSRETEIHQSFGLLQSMLYHSQEITTHYWLTPLLAYIHANPQLAKSYVAYLKHLDTHLLGSTAKGNLVERTREFLDQPWLTNTLNHDHELRRDEGVKFRHYWFYKMEFVLWTLFRSQKPNWKTFRFTAKNSVEHISPQAPVKEDRNTVNGMLNRFGNLALVSRSLNSEYSNLPFNEKRQRFLNRNDVHVDSLKMDLIYQGDQWSDDIATQHENEMIRLMNQYCEDLNQESENHA